MIKGWLETLQVLDTAGELRLRINAYLPVNFADDKFSAWFLKYEPHHAYSPFLRWPGAALRRHHTVLIRPRAGAVVASMRGVDVLCRKVVSSTPLPADRSTRITGGVLYQTDLDKVRAIRLPELAGQWEVTLPTKVGSISMPIPRGFVVEDLTNSAGTPHRLLD